MNVCLYIVLYNFVHDWTDIDDMFCVSLSDLLDDLESPLDQVGDTLGGSQTGILRFTMDIFINKWLLLVIGN